MGPCFWLVCVNDWCTQSELSCLDSPPAIPRHGLWFRPPPFTKRIKLELLSSVSSVTLHKRVGLVCKHRAFRAGTMLLINLCQGLGQANLNCHVLTAHPSSQVMGSTNPESNSLPATLPVSLTGVVVIDWCDNHWLA
jgi:hypothetical protein